MWIKRKLIFTLSSLLVLGFTSTSLISYFVSQSSLRKQIINHELPLTSDNIYSEIQRDLLPPIFISSLMSHDTFLWSWVTDGEKNVSQITQYLSEIQKKYHTFTSFYVSDRTYNYYYSGGVLKKVSPKAERDIWYFRVKKMKALYEINVDPDMAHSDTMTIFINHKVIDAKGQFIGATGVGLKISAVKELVEMYRRKYNRMIYFVSPEGKIVLHNFPSAPESMDINEIDGIKEVAADVLSGKKNDFNYSRSNQNIYLNTRFIPELNWYLLVEQSDDDATRNIFHMLIVNLVFCGLITAVVIAVTAVAVNAYQRKLEKAMKEELALQDINREQQQRIEKQHRQLLEKNIELTQLNSSKDKLFSIIAHDLRSPVGSISQLLPMLEDAIVSGDRNRAADLLDKLKNLSGNTFKLLETLFDWAVNQMADSATNPEPTALRYLIFESLTAFQMAVAEKDLKVKVECADDLKVMADANMLRTIVRNLMSNAIKFTGRGGSIGISAALSAADPKMVEIAFADSGVGIDPARIDSLFDVNCNQSSEGTMGEKGTGLGLSLCRNLVEMNQGRISVKSEVGVGSTFTFTLPLTG